VSKVFTFHDAPPSTACFIREGFDMLLITAPTLIDGVIMLSSGRRQDAAIDGRCRRPLAPYNLCRP
jgi:hypothetical protein